MLQGPPWDVGS